MGDRPFRVENIYEGMCPSCSTPLQRREKDGWCPNCKLGYAAKRLAPGEGEVSLTMDLEDRTEGAFRFTKGRATFTSKASESPTSPFPLP